MELTPEAGDILRFLVECIRTRPIKAGHPETYIGYKEVHDHLGLPVIGDTYGTSLSRQGLGDLAVWARDNGHPAVTGLVVDTKTRMPGGGYWSVNERTEDFMWWKDEVERSLTYDWNRCLIPAGYGETESTPTEAPKTPRPEDFEEPGAPARNSFETYRILRDTELVRRIKLEHQFRCQICGMSINLSNDIKYVEGHHIKPLGEPHNGPDIDQNIICVCPNHHVQLDYGAIPLDKRNLKQTPNHNIGDEFIQYHNNIICRKANNA